MVPETKINVQPHDLTIYSRFCGHEKIRSVVLNTSSPKPLEGR